MGFTGTFASARGDPQFKFFKDYSKMWSNLQVRLVKESDEAMKTRLDTWLEKQLTPPQVFKKLGLTGSFESSRDHPDYKYFEQYSKMWSNLQVRVSQAKRPAKSAEDIMIEKLYYWLKKELTPPQVFKKMGFTGTFASASGDPKYKYFAEMKKLEGFETSLLDGYAVSCLDTLLQQLKNADGESPAGSSVAEPEKVAVGPTYASPNDA
ncbi:hypothetical protein PInf_024893 [Phytophthora infestans]|nr:hypothetical protein PInf_024893 [Phytophthora infestans]